MQILKGFREIKESFRAPVLTIGNFDGLHLGHQSLIREVVARAKKIGGQSIVYTFNPHPQAVLAPSRGIELINTYEEKLQLLREIGVDVVVEEPFSREFSATQPERFFSEIIVKSIAPRVIYVGYDFGFGKDRGGSLEVLKKLCATESVELHIATPLKIEGEVCSSSRIRDYLRAGNLRAANKLLGRNFSYSGPVVKGDARGKKIGFPTANLLAGAKIQVKTGVYATISHVDALGQTRKFLSVTNIGRKPTFHSAETQPVVVETHLFDFDENIYGNQLKVELVEYLRDERKFHSVDALVSQIKIDIAKAREVLSPSED